MSLVAPPRPPVHDDPEALIEEARRRARRRRLALAAAALVIVVAGAVVAVVELTRGTGTATKVPKGFHLVRARGPVRHALLEDLKAGYQTVDLGTGRARPARLTQEIRWDERSGLSHTVYRLNGRTLGGFARQGCQGSGSRRFCSPPSPFDLSSKGLGWSFDPHRAQRAGTGTFRGHRVVWLEGLVVPEDAKPYPSGDQVAYDVVTHQPVGLRTVVRRSRFKGIFSLTAVRVLPDLAAKDVSFVVPDGVAGLNPPSLVTTITGKRMAAAHASLGMTPLWLGRSFRGHRLESVEAGIDAEQTSRRPVRPARFARFDYGNFTLTEFGKDRPFWNEQDPAAGKIVVGGGTATFARDGLLLEVAPTSAEFRLDPKTALALFRALRSVPGG
jgi:hypothetical protein